MKIPTFINWTSPFPFKGLLSGIFHFYSNLDGTICLQANSGDTDVVSDLSLHCLPMSHKKDS